MEGDFTNDGHLDLVVGDYNSDTVYLLLGNGDGSFQAALPISAGDFPVGDHLTAMAAGDFNGDGDLDLAVAFGDNGGTDPGGIEVLLGNGNGTFPGAPDVLRRGLRQYRRPGRRASSAKTAILTWPSRTMACGTVTVLMGNGDGTFQALDVITRRASDPDQHRDGRLQRRWQPRPGRQLRSILDMSRCSWAMATARSGAPSFYAAGNGPQSVVVRGTSAATASSISRSRNSTPTAQLRLHPAGQRRRHVQTAAGAIIRPGLLLSHAGGGGFPRKRPARPGRDHLRRRSHGPAAESATARLIRPIKTRPSVAVDPKLVVAGDFNGDGSST